MEAARTEGLFLKALFTLRLRTKDPLGLLLMGGTALVVLLPFELSIAEMLAGVPLNGLSLYFMFTYPENLVICTGGLFVFGLFGILLLINLVLSLKDILMRTHD